MVTPDTGTLSAAVVLLGSEELQVEVSRRLLRTGPISLSLVSSSIAYIEREHIGNKAHKDAERYPHLPADRKTSRMVAGAHSAAKIETVLALIARPAPKTRRNASRIGQLWLKADPMLPSKQMTVPTKIAPRRPSRLLMGSESHAPLAGQSCSMQ